MRKPMTRLSRRRVYGAAFAVSSLLTPFSLGAVVGGLATGRVAPERRPPPTRGPTGPPCSPGCSPSRRRPSWARCS
ncbi:hypothetical protein ACFSNO_03125 [Streptomyces cirratus]